MLCLVLGLQLRKGKGKKEEKKSHVIHHNRGTVVSNTEKLRGHLYAEEEVCRSKSIAKMRQG